MATAYSAYNSKGWKPSGSSYYKHYQAWVEYWVSSQSETTTNFSAYMGVHIDSSVSANFNARLDMTDHGAVATATGKTVFNAGNTVTLIGTYTYGYARTKTARTIAATGYVWSSQGSWTGEWVGATGYVTVPARTSYAITYDANGGQTVPANQTKYYSTSGETAYYETITSTEPTRVGYTFVKWNTEADGSGDDYSPGDSYTANAAVKLYAQWTPNTYTVTYYKNATDATGTTAQSTFTYDTSGNLRSNGFTRANYLFLGWSPTADGAVLYTNGQSVLNLAPSGNVDLYAVWKYQYTAADLQAPNANRAKKSSPSSDEYIEDEFATGAIISVYVTPGLKETSLGVYENASTVVTAYYIQSGQTGTPTQVGSPDTTTAVKTSTWVISEQTNLSVDLQYDIIFVAQVVDGGAVKASTSIKTIVPLGTFLLDTNPDYDSISLFTKAPDESHVFLIGEGGDINFELDDNDGSGIDYQLLTAFARRGWLHNN